MREHHHHPAKTIPPGVDTSVPNVARVYDFMLGGTFNFPADRRLGEMALEIAPDAPAMAQAHRAFLRRVVRHLAAEGVRQFLDIGALDRIAVSIAPVLLTGGASLLPRRLESDRLRLVSADAIGQFARLVYDVVREPSD